MGELPSWKYKTTLEKLITTLLENTHQSCFCTQCKSFNKSKIHWEDEEKDGNTLSQNQLFVMQVLIKQNLVFNPTTVFLCKNRLQNSPDITITSFSLQHATRSCTWSTSSAWLSLLAGWLSIPAHPPLPFLNEKLLKGVVDSISKAQQHLTY